MHPHKALAFPFLLLFAGCAASLQTIPEGWMTVPETARIRAVELADDGSVKTSPVPAAESVVKQLPVTLQEPLPIESFDVSETRREVAFSARRETGYDIGLVHLDGSPIVWVPADPADEVQVQWAPRGHKISYIVRGSAGDLVRTLHVPSSAQLTVDFPYARVHALGWEPKAERYAVVLSSIDASDRVEVVKYGGEERKTAVNPEVRLDVTTEAFAGGGTLVRPAALKYDERLPLVIWVTETPNAWDDALAALLRSARVAALVTNQVPAAIDLPFVDRNRIYVVNGTASYEGGFAIVGDASVPAGRYRVTRNLVAVAPAVVKSFSAGFIAEQLKRTTPANGSSR
ncbi:MAG TPA: hypothetical protein VF618_28640 [Thermoanaerobaculia bacterium]